VLWVFLIEIYHSTYCNNKKSCTLSRTALTIQQEATSAFEVLAVVVVEKIGAVL